MRRPRNRETLVPLVAAVVVVAVLLVIAGCSPDRRGFSLSSPLAGGREPARPWETTGMSEELWVIEKSSGDMPRSRGDTEKPPSQGELRAKRGEKEIPLPLEHTDVKAQISAFVATVDVTQKYHNPYDTKIEAVYVFPLPQSAAVTEFVMTIGTRRIRAIIREREEAKKIYEEARRQGKVASLLTQERPNIFTQKVANIEPGKKIDINITYFNPLRYDNGEYEFVFPTVVGPRFNPPGSTGGVGAVPRGKAGRSGQKTEVQYLKPGERSGHDIAISVDVAAGVEIEKIYSPTHAVNVTPRGTNRAQVALSPMDAIPNKDFLLRYRVAGGTLKTALLTHRSKDENTFALVLHPPADMKDLPRMPREMVFVLDCSGSMHGMPIAKAKEAMRRCLRKLDENDTFQIIRFSDNASRLGSAPVPATKENLRRGLEYLDGLTSGGGTMMIEGIKAALDFPHDKEKLRIVSFMTDGYIGNETDILAAIEKKLGSARIFSFGVGSAVNRYLLERMAKIGRGAAAFVGLSEGAGAAVDQFYERASRPALAGVEIDWGRMKVNSTYPKSPPDLFVGRPVIITGHFQGTGKTIVHVKGRCGTEEKSYAIDVDLDGPGAEHQGISRIWARWKIAELSDTETHSPSVELKQEITDVSLRYGILSRYTAFLAVDSLSDTSGTHGVTVNVPVPVPDGVRYETTVEE